MRSLLRPRLIREKPSSRDGTRLQDGPPSRHRQRGVAKPASMKEGLNRFGGFFGFGGYDGKSLVNSNHGPGFFCAVAPLRSSPKNL